MLVGLPPEGLCFRSCWLVCRLESCVLGRAGWSVAWRVMFLVVLVGLSPEGLCFKSCWLVCRLKGYILGRVGWSVAWRVVF